MARQRTSADPPQERAKLDSPHRINREIQRIYRLLANKQMPRPEAEGRIKVLTALRAGMPDPVAQAGPGDGTPHVEAITIIGVPRDWGVYGLFGMGEAHMPFEVAQRLRELLPPGSVHRPPSADGILPPLLPPEITDLLDGGDQSPPPEAA